MSYYEGASDGQQLPISDLAVALDYDGSGNVTSLTVDYHNIAGTPTTYVQTLTWTGNNLTNISQWEPQ